MLVFPWVIQDCMGAFESWTPVPAELQNNKLDFRLESKIRDFRRILILEFGFQPLLNLKTPDCTLARDAKT